MWVTLIEQRQGMTPKANPAAIHSNSNGSAKSSNVAPDESEQDAGTTFDRIMISKWARLWRSTASWRILMYFLLSVAHSLLPGIIRVTAYYLVRVCPEPFIGSTSWEHTEAVFYIIYSFGFMFGASFVVLDITNFFEDILDKFKRVDAMFSFEVNRVSRKVGGQGEILRTHWHNYFLYSVPRFHFSLQHEGNVRFFCLVREYLLEMYFVRSESKIASLGLMMLGVIGAVIGTAISAIVKTVWVHSVSRYMVMLMAVFLSIPTMHCLYLAFRINKILASFKKKITAVTYNIHAVPLEATPKHNDNEKNNGEKTSHVLEALAEYLKLDDRPLRLAGCFLFVSKFVRFSLLVTPHHTTPHHTTPHHTTPHHTTPHHTTPHTTQAWTSQEFYWLSLQHSQQPGSAFCLARF